MIRAERLVVALLAAATGIVGCGNSATRGCVSVPQGIPNRVLADHGAKLTVRVGTVVYAVLVEAVELTNRPGFPWGQPKSSDPRVLVPVRLCEATRTSSLPVSVAGFRAVGEGTATLSAPLAPAWRRAPDRPAPYQATVRVLR